MYEANRRMIDKATQAIWVYFSKVPFMQLIDSIELELDSVNKILFVVDVSWTVDANVVISIFS